jgi:CDP-4-dehydro-6-deoxyglucose reductase, E3
MGTRQTPMVVVRDSPFVVAAVETATPSIRRLWLRPLADALAFRPGQYVQLGDAGAKLAPRSYSIANAPRPDGLLSLLVARVAGGATSAWISDTLAAGDEVTVTGPFGTFVDDSLSTAPALYLAAGAGFAPVRALLEAALSDGRRRSLTLVISARTADDVIDAGLLATWQRQDPRFRFVRTLIRGRRTSLGRVPDILSSLGVPLSGQDVFIAGAPGFVHACTNALRALGVRSTVLHTEAFYLEPKPWHDDVIQAARGT